MTWMQSTEFEVLSGQWHEFNIWFSQHLNLGLNRVFWLVDSSECWCLIGQEGQLKIFKAVTLKILKFPYLYHRYCICVINYRSMKAFGQCRRWFWSMTLRHAFVSLTMDIDTNVCIHVIDHWSMTRMLLVNDTDACIGVIDHWSMTRMRAFVSLTVVNDTDACIRVIDQWSMTRMLAFVSLTGVIDWVYTTLGYFAIL